MLLTPAEVAERLGVSEITLKRWRLEGKGPKAVFLSARTIRYKPEAVDEWLHHPAEDSVTVTEDA